MPNEHHHRLSRIAVLDSAILAIACLITFMLVTDLLPRVYHLSRADDLIGGLWAVIAAVFVFRDWPSCRSVRGLCRFSSASACWWCT